MIQPGESSDEGLLNHLRKHGTASVSQLASVLGVTATAVRQRLNRLMAEGWIERAVARAPRGRPSHQYQLTERGRRQAGDNYADLAAILWSELRSIEDREVRLGLLRRVAAELASKYRSKVSGANLSERFSDVAEILRERAIPCELGAVRSTAGKSISADSPSLTILACPYPGLAESDRGVCAMEKMLVSELVGEGVRLAECRLDGDACCTFAAAAIPVSSTCTA